MHLYAFRLAFLINLLLLLFMTGEPTQLGCAPNEATCTALVGEPNHSTNSGTIFDSLNSDGSWSDIVLGKVVSVLGVHLDCLSAHK